MPCAEITALVLKSNRTCEVYLAGFFVFWFLLPTLNWIIWLRRYY